MKRSALLLLLTSMISGCMTPHLPLNPELSILPVFDNEALVTMQQTLVSQHQALAASGYQHAPTSTPAVACEIEPEILWFLATGRKSQADVEQSQQLPDYKAIFENHMLSGTLLEGQCADGKLNGPARLALTRSAKITYTMHGNVMSTTRYSENQHIQARFANNKLDGQLTSSTTVNNTITTNYTGTTVSSIHHGRIGTYRENQPVGDHLSMVWQGPPRPMISSDVRTHNINGSVIRSYMGRQLYQERQTDANEKPHGLHTVYGMVWYAGLPASPEKQECYQHGQLQASLAACGIKGATTTIPAASITSAPTLPGPAPASAATPKARFIADSSGAYLSPITSDGVVAEWVEKSINVALGSSLGSAAGAYAGQKLLGNVPFVGGFLGQKAGSAMGRTAALQSAGGEAFMRSTTDISFTSISDMAAWLKQNHATHPRMGEIIKAAGKIYPDLPLAYAQAR